MAIIVVNVIVYSRYIDIIIIIRHIRKLWKVFITFVMPVRPFLYVWNNSASTGQFSWNLMS